MSKPTQNPNPAPVQQQGTLPQQFSYNQQYPPQYPPGQYPQYPPGQYPQYPQYPPGQYPQYPQYPPGQYPQYPQQPAQPGQVPPQPQSGPMPPQPQPGPMPPQPQSPMPPQPQPGPMPIQPQPQPGPMPTPKPMPPFDVNKDCDDLRKAMKGLGTDEKTIINILGNRTYEQRIHIKNTYKERIKRDLIKDLSDELSFHFKDVILLLFYNQTELDCKYLYDSMHGLGTNEDLLMEIICTRTQEQLAQDKIVFPQIYKTDLCKWVHSDTSGDFRKLLEAILKCERSKNMYPDKQKCLEDAHALYKAGEGRLGTNEDKFIEIFSTRSKAEMTEIFNLYQQVSKKRTLYQAIDSEFSGDIKKSLKLTLQACLDLPSVFAEKLYASMKGLGTRDRDLIRLIVTRCDIDMKEIRESYKLKYDKDLLADIKGDTSGDYMRILLLLAGH